MSKNFIRPPSKAMVLASLAQFSIPSFVHTTPFCSNPSDVPEKPIETLGRTVQLQHPGQVPLWPSPCSITDGRKSASYTVFGDDKVNVRNY